MPSITYDQALATLKSMFSGVEDSLLWAMLEENRECCGIQRAERG